MTSAPDPPDDLPKYIADGVPKQDTSTLEQLQQWIDDLMEYRTTVPRSEIDTDVGASGDESIDAVEESSEGTVVVKKVTCGTESCKCQNGDLHGPYKYVVKRQNGDLVWDYRGPVEERG